MIFILLIFIITIKHLVRSVFLYVNEVTNLFFSHFIKHKLNKNDNYLYK